MNDVQGDAVLTALMCASLPMGIAALYGLWSIRWVVADRLGRLSRYIPV